MDSSAGAVRNIISMVRQGAPWRAHAIMLHLGVQCTVRPLDFLSESYAGSIGQVFFNNRIRYSLEVVIAAGEHEKPGMGLDRCRIFPRVSL